MKNIVAALFVVLLMQAGLAQTGTRRLPPSLERELQLRKGTAPRLMTFSDTLKAKTRIAESIRNTSLQELDSTMVQDSAIVVVDSAVSVSHKQWLDAHIVELPEYKLTASGPRFLYPLSNLLDTRRRVIPFDSTLPQKMETVEHERLTANEALPLTRPIATETPNRILFSIGAGTLSLPSVEAIAFPVKDLRAELVAKNTIDDAYPLKQFFKAKVGLDQFFPVARQRPDVLIPQLNITGEYSSRNRLVRNTLDSGDHTLSLGTLFGMYRIGELAKLSLETSAGVEFLSDDVVRNLNETSADLHLDLRHEERPYLFGFAVDYTGAGQTATPPKTSVSLFSIGATFGLITEEKFKLGGGLGFGSGSDASGSRNGFLPHAFLKWQQNPFLMLSATAARNYRVENMRSLTSMNPFYSAASADTTFAIGDPRRVVLEPLRITAAIEYTVSLVERMGVEVRYIMSEDEPVFDLRTDSATGLGIFIATPKDTRKFEAEGKVTFLLFKGDELNASVLFASSTVTNDERSVPFAPTMTASITYVMKALSPSLTPIIEFAHRARPDKSISLLNAEASLKLTDHMSLFGRMENIFNAAGDFWTGYNEYPRNIMAGVRGTF